MQNTFGKRLRWLRDFKDMTLREFADRVSADPGYLSKLETGKSKNVSQRFLIRVVVAFKVNKEWLATGNGDPFWTADSDDLTKQSLPNWSNKRFQRIFAILDELPDALATDAVIGRLFRDESLEGFQDIWRKVRSIPNLPAPARLFWNDVYVRIQVAKMDEELRQKSGLTDTETSAMDIAVKAQLPGLLERLRKATAEPGIKSELAKFLGVPLASVSRWLSGEREPGGEVTLRLLNWVELRERQAK